jgi:hypothetical protein
MQLTSRVLRLALGVVWRPLLRFKLSSLLSQQAAGRCTVGYGGQQVRRKPLKKLRERDLVQ